MQRTEKLQPQKFDFTSNDLRDQVHDELATNGYACLRQGTNRQIAETVAADIWHYLESVDVYRDEKASWPIGKPLRGPVFRAIRDYDGLTPLFSKTFESEMATLVDLKLREGEEQVLYMTFPESEYDPKRWLVPWAGWHNDFIGDGTGRTKFLLGFVLLNDADAGGGNLVLLSGSHRLKEVIAPQHASAIMKQLSRKSSVLERLWDRREGAPGACVGEICSVDGIDLQVIEMTGNAGDVFLLDGSLLHAPTVNERPHVRLAAKCFFYVTN